MIKRLIEMAVLSALVVGIVYLLNQMGPIGADAKAALKYLWFGLLGISAIAIVSVTLISVVAIVFGIGWLKGLTSSSGSGGFWSGNYFKGKIGGDKIGAFVKQTVESSIRDAFESDSANMSSRNISREYDFSGFDNFKVKTAKGDIKISASKDTRLKINAQIYEKSENDAEIYIDTGEIKLKTTSGKKAFFGDIYVELPAQISSISAESVNGDMKISDISFSGDGIFKNINGDISFSGVKNSAEIAAKTVSGDVLFVKSSLSSIIAQSVSGDISAIESSGNEAVFKTVSGNIDYAGSTFKDVLPKTVSGDIIK
ncbi:MAG: hypothetical protein Fur0012_04220 [Elusimicrobiota bacterium]